MTEMITLPRLQVCGLTLLNARRRDAVAMLTDGVRRRVAFINADCVNIAARDAGYARNLDGKARSVGPCRRRENDK